MITLFPKPFSNACWLTSFLSILFCFFLFILLPVFFNIAVPIDFVIMLSAIPFIFNVNIVFGNKEVAAILLFFIFLSLFGLFGQGVNGLEIRGGGLRVSAIVISSYVLARVALFYGFANLFTLFVLSLLSCLVLYGYLTGVGLNYYDEVFPGGSRNYLGSVVIFSAAAFVFLHYLSKGKVIIWPAAIAFFVSMLMGTRGVMISSLILFFLVILINFGEKKFLYFLAFASVSFVFYSDFFLDAFNNYYYSSKFYESGVGSSRWIMVKAYLNSLNFQGFVLGRNVASVWEIMLHGQGNPHNSFIRGHSLYGVFFVVMLFALMLLIVFKLFFNPRLAILAGGVVVVMLARSLTDILLFGFFLDFFLFLIVIPLTTNRWSMPKQPTVSSS